MNSHVRLLKEKAGFTGFLLLLFALPAFLQAQHTIVYFGDSITEGWIDAKLQPESAFPAKTDSILNATGQLITSINAGIGGNTTEDALRRAGRDVIAADPDLVVIEFGWNDCLIQDPLIGPHVAENRFRENVANLLMLMKFNGIRTIVVGMAPVDSSLFYEYFQPEYYAPDGGIVRHRARYNEILREAAAAHQFPFLEIDFGEGTELRNNLAFDGLHPSANGHSVIANSLAPMIRGYLMEKPQAATFRVEAYPQPFQPEIHRTISMMVPVSYAETAEISIVNETGTLVWRYNIQTAADGIYLVQWDGRNGIGGRVSQGTYFIVVRTNTISWSRRIIVL